MPSPKTSSLFFLLLITSFLPSSAQSQKEIAQKHFQYLNFHSSLNNLVSIDDEGVKIFATAATKKANKPEFTLYWPEVNYFVRLTKTLSPDSLVKIYESKKNKRMGKYWMDVFSELEENKPERKSLAGIKIAIDPGHIAGDFETGKIEQKFLEFPANDTTGLKEPVKITEGILTWQTAMVLKASLEKEGAKVFVTRKEINHTSFGLSYEDWLIKRKKTVLDSLKKINMITAAEHKKFMNENKEKLFWDFFRDHDLANRIKQINEFKPDLAVVVHYNVDEKNKDWLKPSDKNYSMCFIGGGMTADNFKKTISKIHFLRLLVSDDLDKSEKISGLLVKEFEQQLKVAVAKTNDATYLENNCVVSGTPGVYCRNLALCRGISAPLVYGECLYQDHFDECVRLNKCDKEYNGIKTSERVKEVADSYYQAVMKFFGPQ